MNLLVDDRSHVARIIKRQTGRCLGDLEAANVPCIFIRAIKRAFNDVYHVADNQGSEGYTDDYFQMAKAGFIEKLKGAGAQVLVMPRLMERVLSILVRTPRRAWIPLQLARARGLPAHIPLPLVLEPRLPWVLLTSSLVAMPRYTPKLQRDRHRQPGLFRRSG